MRGGSFRLPLSAPDRPSSTKQFGADRLRSRRSFSADQTRSTLSGGRRCRPSLEKGMTRGQRNKAGPVLDKASGVVLSGDLTGGFCAGRRTYSGRRSRGVISGQGRRDRLYLVLGGWEHGLHVQQVPRRIRSRPRTSNIWSASPASDGAGRGWIATEGGGRDPQMSDIDVDATGVQRLGGRFPGCSISGFHQLVECRQSGSRPEKPFDERKRMPRSAGRNSRPPLNKEKYAAIPGRLSSHVSARRPLNGLGTTAAPKLQIRRSAQGARLRRAERLRRRAFRRGGWAKAPGSTRVFSSFRSNVPQMFADIGSDQGLAARRALTDVVQTGWQIYLGSLTMSTDVKPRWPHLFVYVQADCGRSARAPDDIRQLKVPFPPPATGCRCRRC